MYCTKQVSHEVVIGMVARTLHLPQKEAAPAPDKQRKQPLVVVPEKEEQGGLRDRKNRRPTNREIVTSVCTAVSL